MASTPVVPEGYKLHTENTSHILLPSTNEAFLNPVQEFNRDTSVACIRVWSEELNRTREAKWRRTLGKKTKKGPGAGKKRFKKDDTMAGLPPAAEPAAAPAKEDVAVVPAETTGDVSMTDVQPLEVANPEPPYIPYKFVLLEALSATGLRSIRYAKEIPLVKYVIANDLSSSAVVAMKRNIELNGLGDPAGPAEMPTELPATTAETSTIKPTKTHMPKLAKIRVNEGDACTLMYSHREERNRVDVVDLDPYGTAAPFIDAAVQSIADGGLLCITCTDLAVLATTNYPEKCFSNYGGVSVKAEYCHEAALRLVLHTVATSAARYGRYIEPLLSLSIDFYVRLFIRVQSGALEVKKIASKTSTYYVCSGCQSFYDQPLGRTVEKVAEKSGNTNILFKTHSGPGVPEKCPECGFTLHIAGPMWSHAIHNKDFVSKVLEHIDTTTDKYGTAPRMKGMLTVARDELETPFFFTPTKMAGSFHCVCPPLEDVVSGLLHAGHQVSRSHAQPGSLKTTATREDVHDLFRSWVKLNPVKMANVPAGSPGHQLLSKEPRTEANFERHPDASTAASKVKLVRYQQNPTANWGPGSKAVAGSGKRKRSGEDAE